MASFQSAAPDSLTSSETIAGRKGIAWRRLLARLGDSGLMLAAAVILSRNAWADGNVTSAGVLQVWAVWVLLSIVYDALCITAAATTPAKNLFGIRIVDKHGKRLSLSASLGRSTQALVRGQGLHVWPLSWVTLWMAYKRFVGTGEVSWDASTHVDAEPLSRLQMIVAAYMLASPMIFFGVAIYFRYFLQAEVPPTP